MADLRSTGSVRALIEMMLWSGFAILVLAIGAAKSRDWGFGQAPAYSSTFARSSPCQPAAAAAPATQPANPWVDLQPRRPKP